MASFQTPLASSFALSSFLKPPRFPFLNPSVSTHNNIKRPFLSLVTNSQQKFSNGRYIREDYLIKKVSSKEVEDLVKGERNVPLVVDFYATWCGPCILMAQELEMLAVEYESNVLFVKVDTDDEYEFSRDMQVRGLPTLIFISPDLTKDAIRTEGLIPTQMIRDIINNDM